MKVILRILLRILAGFTLLLSLAGLLLSLAGGVGVWIVKEPATTKATYVFGRIEAALDVADEGLDHLKTSLARAAERLDRTREEQRWIAQQPGMADMARRFLARTVQQTMAPQFADAHEKFHKVAEAALVANSVLEDLGTFPFLSVSGLDVSYLTEINSSLADVESKAWELSRLLGEPSQVPDADGADARLSRIEQILQNMQGLIAEYEPLLTQVRERTNQLKTKTLYWVTPAAVVVSSVCFWIALSQVSLLFHACSWWRHAGRNNSRP